MTQTLENALEGSLELLEKFKDMSEDDKWNAPFPMGVFGTLRNGQCNCYLMGNHEPDGKKKKKSKTSNDEWRWGACMDVGFRSHHRAFLPHFTPRGLRLFYSPNASGYHEIFTYTADEWKKMIPSVDSLESFNPRRHINKAKPSSYYHRTLVWLHVLPKDFDIKPHYAKWRIDYGDAGRTLDIAPGDWGNFKKFPCWVYSNGAANAAVKKEQESDSPVIWDGYWFD